MLRPKRLYRGYLETRLSCGVETDGSYHKTFAEDMIDSVKHSMGLLFL